MKKYDVIVVGGGAGTKLVGNPADKGLKVAVIEELKLGGTCLNRGCIPSKMLIHVADVASTINRAHRYDLKITSEPEVFFTNLVRYVNQTIDKESDDIAEAYNRHPNIDFYNSRARFKSNTELEVDGEILTSDKIVIPVGASAAIPENIEGLNQVPYMTYTEALRNEAMPEKMIVIGGGYIAAELGYFYSALGVDTTFLVRSCMLRREDLDVQAEFQKAFHKYHDVRIGAIPKKVSFDHGKYRVTYLDTHNNEYTIESDALLVATGVKANTENLGLENTDIELDERGFIKVDDHLQTTVDGIYSFGDSIGRELFRHTANFEGEYLVDQLFGDGPKKPLDYSPVPHAVFANPQIGGVGKTEQDLQSEGVDYVSGLNPYAKSAMGMALRSEFGFCKLLFDRATKKLLGGHIIGEEASNMIHTVIAYMNMGATLDDMLSTIYIHPALPEIVRNAARIARKSL
jgi:mycothione reductase